MSHLLTPQGVRKLLAPKDTSGGEPITVQVIHIRNVPSTQGDRYRVVLSDGEFYTQGMMSSQLNYLVSNGNLSVDGLVVIQDFMCNQIQGKNIVILLSAEALSENPGRRLGTPKDFMQSEAGKATANANEGMSAQPLYNSTNSHTMNDNNNSYVKPEPVGNGSMSVSPTRSSGGKNPYGRPSSSSSSINASSNAPIVRSSNTVSTNYTLIKNLNLYHSRWTIQARITSKSDIRTWSNAKGEGSLFTIELLDQEGTDIRCTFFKEAVDKFYSVLQEGQVYTFSGGRLKVANARWNNCKSPHEITFDQNSEIHLCAGGGHIQDQVYEFVDSIASIESLTVDPERQLLVDVLALVQSVGDTATIVSKKRGQEYTKCDVTLVDDSNAKINLTLWNEQAQRASTLMPLNELVAVRRVRVSDFGGGKSLSGPHGVALAKNESSVQKMSAYSRLLDWFQKTGGQGATRSLSGSGGGFGGPTPFAERKQIANIKAEHLGYQSEKGDYISFTGTITFLKKDKEGGAWYPACPNTGAKVTPTASGAGDAWSCERCQTTYDRCVRRWIFSGVVEDVSASTWVTFFNDTAELLFDGKTADEIFLASDGTAPSDAYDSVFAKASFTEWIFKCKVKNEMVNEETRRKVQVNTMHPLNYVQESKEMLAAISRF